MRKALSGWVGMATLAALVGLAPLASAHTAVVSSNPAAGSSVAAPPNPISITFSEPIADHDYVVSVVDSATRSLWPVSNVGVDGDHRSLTAQLGALGPVGTYTINYRVLAADGHPATGSIAFTVTSMGTGQPTAQVTEIGSGDLARWLVIGLGLLVVVGVTLFGISRARRSR